MSRHILLLTARREVPAFREFLLSRNRALAVEAAHSLADLEAAIDRRDGRTRLLSFLSETIVPPRLLDRLAATPYNIHPAPPDYPGSHPESFAIWERAPRYGATAHEMVAKVDAGPIVAVTRFDMPPAPTRLALGNLAYLHALRLFAALAAFCATHDGPMPHLAERWGPCKRTRADFRALCRAPSGLSPADLRRLEAACGHDFVPPPAGMARAG